MGHMTFEALAKSEGWDIERQHAELSASHYDMYKSAHGIRPRWLDYDSYSIADLVLMVECVSREAAEEYQRQLDDERGYSDADIMSMLACGAMNKATAIRWAKQANR